MALEFAGRSMCAATDLLFGQCSKPAFDLVEPRGRGRREMDVEETSGTRKNTQRAVQFELTEQTREALAAWIATAHQRPEAGRSVDRSIAGAQAADSLRGSAILFPPSRCARGTRQ